ncbi:MAG: hypothetical protein ACOCRK_04495 [bacterium]
MNIKIINDVKQTTINKKKDNSFKVSLNNKNIIDNRNIKDKIKKHKKNIDFKVGQKVKHKEEGIIGEVKFVGSKIAIAWDDNTRERLTLEDAIESLDYVSDIQNEIAPLAPQITKSKEDEEITSNVEDEEIDIEKIKMERKIEKLESQLDEKNADSVKDKVANDLIDLMIAKGMIEEDDREIEKTKIIAMNDNQFENYRQEIVAFDDSHKVTSQAESYEPLTEAERALQKIKGNGGRGIIGDFSNQTSSTSNMTAPRQVSAGTGNGNEGRNLNSVKDKKFTYNSYKNNDIPPSFSDQFSDILSSKLQQQRSKQPQQLEKKTAEQKQTLPGFENLQGLTKPVQITEKSASFPSNTSMKELISELDWTTLSKLH